MLENGLIEWKVSAVILVVLGFWSALQHNPSRLSAEREAIERVADQKPNMFLLARKLKDNRRTLLSNATDDRIGHGLIDLCSESILCHEHYEEYDRLGSAANVAALKTNVYPQIRVIREDVGAIYEDTQSTCAKADDGTQIQPVRGSSIFAGHCWKVLPSTPIKPEIFDSFTNSDVTAAFQGAIDATCAGSQGGGRILLASKIYDFKGSTSLHQTCAIQWVGSGWSESPPSTTKGGTWFHISTTGATANGGKSLFAISDPNARGTTWEGIGISEDQPTPGSRWEAMPYPVVFSIVNLYGGVRFHNILANPVYDLIYSDNSGRMDVGGLYGQVLHYGLQIFRSFDTTHGSTGPIHFWPYWSADTSVLQETQLNGSAIMVLGRVDGASFPDVFGFGFNNGIQFVKDPGVTEAAAFASGVSFGTLYADATVRPLYVKDAVDQGKFHSPLGVFIQSFNASCSGFGTDIAKGAIANSAIGGTPILIEGAIVLDISSLTVQACINSTIDLASTTIGSRITIGHATVYDLQHSMISAPSVNAPGSVQHDISFATRPHTEGPKAGFLFQPQLSLASTSIPLLESAPLIVSDHTKFVFPVNTRNVQMSGNAASIDAVTLILPSNPYPNEEATLVSTSRLTDFRLVTAASNVEIAPKPLTIISAYQTLRYRYNSIDCTWEAF